MQLVSQIGVYVRDLEAAVGSWRRPEFWATLASLAGAIAAVAWPGVAPMVKAAVIGGGSVIVAVTAVSSHATHRQIVRTAADAVASAAAGVAKAAAPTAAAPTATQVVAATQPASAATTTAGAGG